MPGLRSYKPVVMGQKYVPLDTFNELLKDVYKLKLRTFGAGFSIIGNTVTYNPSIRTAFPVTITALHADTKTGASDYRMYIGDIYATATGFDGDKTQEDITVFLVDLDAGDELDTLPTKAIGQKRTFSWVDKNAVTITETVLFVQQGGGGGVSPVELTAKVDDNTYTGNVFGNGRHNAATESGVTIKVGVIAAGESLPTSGDYAWFDAHLEKWDVGGVDTKLRTIQPGILR